MQNVKEYQARAALLRIKEFSDEINVQDQEIRQLLVDAGFNLALLDGKDDVAVSAAVDSFFVSLSAAEFDESFDNRTRAVSTSSPVDPPQAGLTATAKQPASEDKDSLDFYMRMIDGTIRHAAAGMANCDDEIAILNRQIDDLHSRIEELQQMIGEQRNRKRSFEIRKLASIAALETAQSRGRR